MRSSIILLLLTFWLTAQGQRDRRLDEIDSLIANEDYTTAIQRIDLKRPSADERTLGLLASRTASILILQGNLDAAETVLKPHLNSSDPFTEAVTRTRMGFLHLNKARNDLALEDLQNSLELFEKAGQSKSPEAATCLTYLSLVYLSSGKINQALENALVTLNLHEQLYGENTEETAAAYNDLGLVYSGINPDLALEYYEKALAIYEKVHGKNHRKIAIALTNIGIMYRQMKLYGDAINDFESAEAIWKKVYPNGHPNQALALLNLGITYGQMGDRNAALGYCQKALVIYRNSYGTKHSDIANVLNQIGLLKLTQNRYGEALRSYQQALISNAPGFNDTTLTANPGSRDYYNGKVLLFSLRLKAEALEALHYGKTLRFRDLEQAVTCLQVCDTLLDNLRYHSQDENDKLELGNAASDVYEDGVRITHAMGLMSFRARSYNDLAFYFAEKSKSAVLQSSIADAEAKSYAGIPEELLDREKYLKAETALLTQKLSQKPSHEEEVQIRQSLLTANKDYQQFIDQLEKDFPQYYNLKFNKTSPSVLSIQETLDNDHAVVSYFVAEHGKMLYTFIITKKKFRIVQSRLPDEFDKIVKGFNNSLFYSVPEGYRATANQLSLLLLRGLPNTRGITVIPSGRLSTLPFEALPISTVREPVNYETLPYLISRYDVNYSFSAGLLLQKTAQQTETVRQATILLCAPVQFPDNQNLDDLPGTEREVNEIARLFGPQARIFKQQDANEQIAKSAVMKQFSLIHFATHGIVDEEHPELSRIFLNPSGNEDGMLYSGEVFNLQMKADLAALSACQTGLGKFSKGEGVIGLSRALLYAGAKNILVSYWSVADESTSLLMTDFYKNLLKNPSGGFSPALQKAKQKCMSEPRFASPFYWAPFVLIGNN